MTDLVARDRAAEDWIGCLLLAVAPSPYMPQVRDAVRRAERAVFGDPVLMDTARVGTTGASDPLAGDLDDIARGLYRELVAWGRSPARNPAPRFTYCLLVLDVDVQEADRLIHSLAATNALSGLPIIFRVGDLPPEPASPEAVLAERADDDGHLTRMILDAVTATAHEVEKTPDFSLTTGQLAQILESRRRPPSPAPALDRSGREPEKEGGIRALPSGAEPPAERDEAGPPIREPAEPAGSWPAAADDRQSTQDGRGDDTGLRAGQPDSRRWLPGGGTLAHLLARPPKVPVRESAPASGVEVIDELAERTDSVTMLYLVLVSEPVRPARRARGRRVDVALALARALLSRSAPWYIRAFAADQELHAGTTLAGPDLRSRDVPQRWLTHFDLYETVGDLIDAIERDASSFERRGLSTPRAVVVFLAGPAPEGGADSARRLADLCAAARTVWVSFNRDAVAAEHFTATDAAYLSDHDDVVDEVLALLEARPGPLADDIPTQGPADPPEVEAPEAVPAPAER